VTKINTGLFKHMHNMTLIKYLRHMHLTI